jgi:hypothetical protein
VAAPRWYPKLGLTVWTFSSAAVGARGRSLHLAHPMLHACDDEGDGRCDERVASSFRVLSCTVLSGECQSYLHVKPPDPLARAVALLLTWLVQRCARLNFPALPSDEHDACWPCRSDCVRVHDGGSRNDGGKVGKWTLAALGRDFLLYSEHMAPRERAPRLPRPRQAVLGMALRACVLLSRLHHH